MLILYGNRTKRVKKHVDNHVQCKECKGHTHLIEVYQKYFHIFFIPFVPYGKKLIATQCTNCGNDSSEDEFMSYLRQTKTPFYMYSGLILAAILIIGLFAGAKNDAKLEQEYIANPAVGDVYLVKDSEEDKAYYFMKVKAVEEDSVFVLMNAYVYKQYTSKFDKRDYFDLSNAFYIRKTKLQEAFDNQTIKSVSRGYNESSRFNVEKDGEE